MAEWPFHKFMNVRLAYRAEGRRQKRALARLSGDEDVLEWNNDRFEKPRTD